jgi:hypothetical protein
MLDILQVAHLFRREAYYLRKSPVIIREARKNIANLNRLHQGVVSRAIWRADPSIAGTGRPELARQIIKNLYDEARGEIFQRDKAAEQKRPLWQNILVWKAGTVALLFCSGVPGNVVLASAALATLYVSSLKRAENAHEAHTMTHKKIVHLCGETAENRPEGPEANYAILQLIDRVSREAQRPGLTRGTLTHKQPQR